MHTEYEPEFVSFIIFMLFSFHFQFGEISQKNCYEKKVLLKKVSFRGSYQPCITHKCSLLIENTLSTVPEITLKDEFSRSVNRMKKCYFTSFVCHNHHNGLWSISSRIIGSQRDQVLSVGIEASQRIALKMMLQFISVMQVFSWYNIATSFLELSHVFGAFGFRESFLLNFSLIFD